MIDLSDPHRSLSRWGSLVVPEITLRCNVNPRCSFCNNKAVDMRTATIDMSQDTFNTMADQCAEIGTSRIAMTGGEPLMREDLPVLIKKIVSVGCIASMATNGDLLTHEKLDEIVNAGLTKLSVSYYSTNQCEKIMNILEMAEDYDIDVNINSVLTSQNYFHYNSMVRECAAFDCVKSWSKFNPHPFSFAKAEDVYEFKKDAMAKRLYYLQQELEGSIKIWLFERPRDYFALKKKAIPDLKYNPCGACKGTYIGVTPDGAIRLCAYRVDPIIGYVNKVSLKELEAHKEQWFNQTKEACPHIKWLEEKHPELV